MPAEEIPERDVQISLNLEGLDTVKQDLYTSTLPSFTDPRPTLADIAETSTNALAD
jgi:hypothetical protein